MAAMSMNTVIHRAFRRDLDRFVNALDGFTPGDERRAAQLALAWDNFDDQLTHHHEGEHEVAWPHLQRAGVSRELLDAMDGEHDVMAGALARARDAMADLRREPSGEHARAAASALRELRSTTVAHLDHEERELEPFYLANEDHPEVVAMGKPSPGSAPREAAGSSPGSWMAPPPRSSRRPRPRCLPRCWRS